MRLPLERRLTDSELIDDEIEQQVSQCQCEHTFRAAKIGDGKYRVRKLCTICYLSSRESASCLSSWGRLWLD